MSESVVFVANVGSRDVQVQGVANLPRDSRTLGETILSDWTQYRSQLVLPILAKALDWVLKMNENAVSRIILFASDQRDSQFRHTDTLPFAQIIQRMIDDKYGATISQRVQIVSIDSNPADYDGMLHFYAQHLQSLAGNQRVYLEVTGGTPAMSFMLLWQGVELLGEYAYPLYVLQNQTRPLNLTIGRELKAKSLISDIKLTLASHQYKASQGLLERSKGFLNEVLAHPEAVQRLIAFALARYNFNFGEAERALSEIERYVPNHLRPQALTLAEDIGQRDDIWLLREEIYAAELDFRNGAYKDALANVFAFYEGALRLLALHYGMKLVDNRKIDPEWLASIPKLADYFKEKSIDTNRNVTTFVFERYLGFRARSDASIKPLSEAIEAFKALAAVRNEAIHNHNGVAENDIHQAYTGGISAVLAALRDFMQRLQRPVMSDNPYDALNRLVLELLDTRK